MSIPTTQVTVKSSRTGLARAFVRFGVGAFAALAALSAAVPIATGTGTDPTLALTRVSVEAGSSARAVRLEGEFPADDLVQLAYPLQILIRETGPAARYVRYDTSAGVVTGVAPELFDGLAPDEAVALLGQGSPSPDAKILFLGGGRIEVLLPEAFPDGGAEVQLYVVEAGEPILSNPLPFAVSGAGS